MIKTAIIGASGFVGHHLLNRYRGQYPDCIGTTFSKKIPGLQPFDIRNDNVETLDLKRNNYEAVVIASSITKIPLCESKPSLAYEINVEGTLNVIKKLSEMSIKTIFLSSDYVFDGIEGNYCDEHKREPNTVYGKYKAIVEREIYSIDEAVVLRLAKIYGLEKGDNTILDEGANLLCQNKQILAATDQYFCPTYIHDLIEAIISIQEAKLTGCLNVCGPEKWSRYDMYKKLAYLMGKNKRLVKGINLYDLEGMKGRPLDTSMTCKRLNNEIRSKFTPLEDAMVKVVTNYS